MYTEGHEENFNKAKQIQQRSSLTLRVQVFYESSLLDYYFAAPYKSRSCTPMENTTLPNMFSLFS
jgi:hypothetical protein